MHWYLTVLRKYVVFQGRASRTEFWMFTLISFLISIGLAILENMIGLADLAAGQSGPLGGIYSLAVFVPTIMVSIRRLHDTGRSGLWLLLILLPIIGWIALIIFYCQPSEAGPNRFGDVPPPVGPVPVAA